MKLIAEARASEILGLGDGRVLRRSDAGGNRAQGTGAGLEEAARCRLADPNVNDAGRAEVRRLLGSQYD